MKLLGKTFSGYTLTVQLWVFAFFWGQKKNHCTPVNEKNAGWNGWKMRIFESSDRYWYVRKYRRVGEKISWLLKVIYHHLPVPYIFGSPGVESIVT